VTPVACPGLATAIDAGDETAMTIAIADAADRTPKDCSALVLGCTEYELADDRIGAAVPGAMLFGTAGAVAAQTLRRAALAGRDLSTDPNAEPGKLTVLLSCRRGDLPLAALQYRQGRELAHLATSPTPAPAPDLAV